MKRGGRHRWYYLIAVVVFAVAATTLGLLGAMHRRHLEVAPSPQTPVRPSPSQSTAPKKRLVFYVNDAENAHCDDRGPGTSLREPWCGFAPINKISTGAGFRPGTTIELRAGDVWHDQELVLSGSGSPSEWISVTSYGNGPPPQVVGPGINTSSVDILLTNPDYWSFSDLAVRSAGEGILVWFTTADHQGLRFSNISSSAIGGTEINGRFGVRTALTDQYHVHRSSAIMIMADAVYGASNAIDENIVVDRVTGIDNEDTVAFEFRAAVAAPAESAVIKTTRKYAYHNVVIRGLDLQHGATDLSGGSSDALFLTSIEGGEIVDSTINDQCATHTRTGTAAIIVGGDEDVLFANDVITNVVNTRSPNQTGFDYESTNDHVDILNSYFGHNPAAGVQILSIHGGATESSNIAIIGNAFVDNGWVTHGEQGALQQVESRSTIFPNGSLANNIYSEPNGFLSTGNHGSWARFALTNNVSAGAVASSAHDFSATQGQGNWYYAISRDGQQWTMIPSGDFVVAQQKWIDAGNQIGAYTVDPAQGYAVSRAWRVPRTGTITITGGLVYPGAGGVLPQALRGQAPVAARITVDNRQVWPKPANGGQASWQAIPYGGGRGIEIALDNLSVVKGDSVRFEVEETAAGTSSPGAGSVSWMASIGY